MIVLFYSQQCQYCKTVVTAIQKSSLQSNIKMFCIDGFQPLPQYLKAVPTIKIYESNTLLVGEDILLWLDTYKQQQEIEDQVAASTGSYTMLDQDDSKTCDLDSVYNSRISTPQGQIPSKNGPTQQQGGGNFPQTEKMQTGGLDQAFEKMVAERNNIGNDITRI